MARRCRCSLIADLLCAALVAPALLGLWRRTTTVGVLAGTIAGLAGAVTAAWVATGSLAGAVNAVTFADAVPTLPPFAGAVVAGRVVTVAVSLAARCSADLSRLEATVRARATAEREDSWWPGGSATTEGEVRRIGALDLCRSASRGALGCHPIDVGGTA